MKLLGGYSVKIAGRPSSVVREVAVPEKLVISLAQNGLAYSPAVKHGDSVAFGSPLAWGMVDGGRVALPAPAAGRVAYAGASGQAPERLLLEVADAAVKPCFDPLLPERAAAADIRARLGMAGLWTAFWSSRTRGIPALDGSEAPVRILVNSVKAEPFRTRGKVILSQKWKQVVTGLRFLQRLLAEYGGISLVLTELNDPIAQSLRDEVAGQAWVEVVDAPLRYPTERPEVLCRGLLRSNPKLDRKAPVWVVDVQDVAAMGACLGEGLPAFQRVVAVGGPGATSPAHALVRIGTELPAVLANEKKLADSLLLRGGLFHGRPVAADAAVGWGDDGFFLLPRMLERDFLGFLNPGLDRVSVLPCFAARLFGRPDTHLSNSLRGERRPCIGCGLCEKVCPAGLMPQFLHRYLYRQALEEAKSAGLELCLKCGLCSYVCPSKIELLEQFEQAMATIKADQDEAAAANSRQHERDESKQQEKERSTDWLK